MHAEGRCATCAVDGTVRPRQRSVYTKYVFEWDGKKEARFLRLGRSVLGRVLIVAYTQRKAGHGETIRIISARQASRRERTAYVRAAED
jgi:uncharacterized DUF497 family protein